MENGKRAIKCRRQKQVYLGTNTKWEQLSERNTERHACHSSSNTISVLRDHHARDSQQHVGLLRGSTVPRGALVFLQQRKIRPYCRLNVARSWSSESHSGPSTFCAVTGDSEGNEAWTLLSQVSPIHKEKEKQRIVSVLQKNALQSCDTLFASLLSVCVYVGVGRGVHFLQSHMGQDLVSDRWSSDQDSQFSSLPPSDFHL